MWAHFAKDFEVLFEVGVFEEHANEVFLLFECEKQRKLQLHINHLPLHHTPLILIRLHFNLMLIKRIFQHLLHINRYLLQSKILNT